MFIWLGKKNIKRDFAQNIHYYQSSISINIIVHRVNYVIHVYLAINDTQIKQILETNWYEYNYSFANVFLPWKNELIPDSFKPGTYTVQTENNPGVRQLIFA